MKLPLSALLLSLSLTLPGLVRAETIEPEWSIPRVESVADPDAGPTEAQWNSLKAFTSFFFPWEKESAPATSLKLCHDGFRIFFRSDVTDSDVVVLGDPACEMDVCGGDRFEIFLDSSDQMTRYYGLEMDPNGRVLDYQASFYRQFRRQVSVPGVRVTGERIPNGYRVSGSLDLQQMDRLGLLHLKPGAVYLRAGFFRAEFSHNPKFSGTQTNSNAQANSNEQTNSDEKPILEKWISWKHPGTPEADFHVPAALGWVKLEELLGAGGN